MHGNMYIEYIYNSDPTKSRINQYKVIITADNKLIKGDTEIETVFEKDINAHEQDKVEGEFYWEYMGIK